MPINLHAYKLWFVFTVLLLVLQACSTNPISVAKTAEQRAFAAYGTFVVFEEQAAALIVNPSIPADIKKGIQEADAKAKPAADSLIDAALQAISIRKQFEAAETTEEKLQLAIDNLDGWIVTSRPLIENLVDVVEGGK